MRKAALHVVPVLITALMIYQASARDNRPLPADNKFALHKGELQSDPSRWLLSVFEGRLKGAPSKSFTVSSATLFDAIEQGDFSVTGRITPSALKSVSPYSPAELRSLAGRVFREDRTAFQGEVKKVRRQFLDTFQALPVLEFYNALSGRKTVLVSLSDNVYSRMCFTWQGNRTSWKLTGFCEVNPADGKVNVLDTKKRISARNRLLKKNINPGSKSEKQ